MRRKGKPSAASEREQLREQVHILEGIQRAMVRWPEVLALAFEADSAAALVEGLRALLEVDEVQASAISDMQVRRVGQLERERVARGLTELRAQLSS